MKKKVFFSLSITLNNQNYLLLQLFKILVHIFLITFISYITEAISMADRIIVLTKRPSTIKTIYEINLTNKSTPIKNRHAKEFSDYYDVIWKDIDFHV